MTTGGFNQNWVTFVSAVLKKHGASLRSQRQRTGLSHTTIASWLQGVNPGVEGVRAFARGFGEDEGEALRAAGYETLAPATDSSTAPALDALELRMRELAERYDAPDLMLRLHKGDEALTPEAVDRWAARMEDFLKDLQAEQPKD